MHIHIKFNKYIRKISIYKENIHLMALTRTTWVSQHQNGKLTILNFNKARDGGWQWHQLEHMQSICTLLHHTTPATHHSIFTGQMFILTLNQQCQSTKGNMVI